MEFTPNVRGRARDREFPASPASGPLPIRPATPETNVHRMTAKMFMALVVSTIAGIGPTGPVLHAQETAAPDTAAAAPLADGETLFKTKTCFTCHGADAKTPLLPMYPKLAGQNPEYALQQMIDIKSGARANGQTAAMKGIMHLVNEDEMKILAEYVAGLQP